MHRYLLLLFLNKYFLISNIISNKKELVKKVYIIIIWGWVSGSMRKLELPLKQRIELMIWASLHCERHDPAPSLRRPLPVG
jgi:hypothetical protein